MNSIEDIKTATPIKINRVAGVSSGTVDTLGAHKALIRFVKGPATTKAIWRVGHTSASTTLYASATQFSTPIIVSSVTSGQTAYEIDLTGCKRHLRVRQSMVTTSAAAGVIVDLVYNREIPPTSTGFVSVTRQGA
jgi:hypothetical protein